MVITEVWLHILRIIYYIYYKFKSLGVWEIFPALFEVGKENY